MASFIYTDNGLHVFGSNYEGRLGLGKDFPEAILSPTKLNFFDDHEIITVHFGMFHGVVRAKDGIFVFGLNDFGQLGLGDTQNRETPQRLKFFDNHEILSIHSGDFYVLVYTTDGLFGFGSNKFGELGLGDNYDRYAVPTKLDFFDNYDILSIHCINSRTFVNTNNGLYVFGWNYFRQLGLEDDKNCNTPNKLDFFDNYEIVTICGGSYHTIIQTKTGVFGFGGGGFGQLGLGDTSRQFLPTKLNFFDDYEIISVECGYRHSIVITTKGVYVFGDNGCGQLGLGEDFSLHKTIPTKLNFFDKHQILLITCYADNNMIYTTQGLYVFGGNFYGELGLGDRNIRRVPVKLNFEHEIIPLINKPNIRIKSSHSFI